MGCSRPNWRKVDLEKTEALTNIKSASIGMVKSNQQSILNYHSVFRLTVNSQQSTVNNNSGATGIDIKTRIHIVCSQDFFRTLKS